MIIFRGELTDVLAQKEALVLKYPSTKYCYAVPVTVHLVRRIVRLPRLYSVPAAVLPFSKLNKIFFGYFDPEHNFLYNENK